MIISTFLLNNDRTKNKLLNEPQFFLIEVTWLIRSSLRRCSMKKYLAKFTGKHLYQSLFSNKVASRGLQLCYKRDPGTGVFLWILRSFQEHLFYRTPPVAASTSFPSSQSWLKVAYFFSRKEQVSLHPKSNICNFR